MKKILLASVGIVLALGMTGCSTNTANQSVKNLNAQLERVDNVVVASVNDETSEISNSSSNNTTSNLNYLANKAYNDMLEERYLKDEILSLSSYLKSNQNTNYKLAKSDINALKTLTSDLSKYTSYLNDSKSTVKSYVKKIKNQSKTVPEQISSSYQALSNIMNERKAYLNNLLNTMNEVANILCENNIINSQDCEQNTESDINENELNTNNYQYPNYNNYNNYNNQYYTPYHYNRQNSSVDYNINTKEQNNKLDTNNSSTNNDTGKGLTKNIDTYNKNRLNENILNSNNNSSQNLENASNQNGGQEEQRLANNGYAYQYNYYNNPYYNPYYNGYNSYYNPNYRFFRHGFNPNRNTDTYYPLNRNIDTYRMSPEQYTLSATNMNEGNTESGITNTTKKQVNEQKNINIESANNENDDSVQDETPKIKHIVRNVKQKTAKNNESEQAEQIKKNIQDKNTDNSVLHYMPKKLDNEDKEINNKIKPVEKAEKDVIYNQSIESKNVSNNDSLNSNKEKQKTVPIKIENTNNIMATFIKDGTKKLNNKANHIKEKIGKVEEVQFS